MEYTIERLVGETVVFGRSDIQREIESGLYDLARERKTDINNLIGLETFIEGRQLLLCFFGSGTAQYVPAEVFRRGFPFCGLVSKIQSLEPYITDTKSGDLVFDISGTPDRPGPLGTITVQAAAPNAILQIRMLAGVIVTPYERRELDDIR